ncbi:SUMO-activating enzyme subunit 2 isoform X2 [Daphnia magna]|uniref:SUMO-activating enzyme subunit 2 isoform X2 n=1 Tax=Daphnia magna TaxID=35525 RepID=UPI001E1BBD96|nr:SUMO-activating enzyme subunit 2 isoform X2 [Daphnia magna]
MKHSNKNKRTSEIRSNATSGHPARQFSKLGKMADVNVAPSLLDDSIRKSKILVVGAGGIGCELLKNLVLSGFNDILVIDLDTIDVSNLNRQFLFQKEHVGKSKAVIARESALGFNPNVTIVAKHDSVMNSEYNVTFFKQFTVVMNALDNRAARSHVNRMCLAANVPLIESGTAGYLGQVTAIRKGLSECYDCNPKAGQKSFPGCTIRNTPSEPIHCIVWAKHLFNQLFGEADPDEDVSPDTADPEAAGDAGSVALQNQASEAGNVTRVSTRAWAQQSEYDPSKLFGKFFCDDIKYLLSMDKLWTKRTPPTPLSWDNIPEEISDQQGGLIKDQKVWSPAECVQAMVSSIKILYQRSKELNGEESFLVWDKDDEASMDFVTACSNLRSHVFSIPKKSRFDVKAMAGNIIPAIATTNAVIAGLIVFEAFKILEGKWEECRHVYLNSKPNALNKVIAPSSLDSANPKCYVCSPHPEVTVLLNVSQMTVQSFEDKVLRGALHMISPDVMVDDGKGTVLISSEEGETTENMSKSLSDFNISDGTRLRCEDFHQEYDLNITIIDREHLEENREFTVIADPSQLQPKAAVESSGPQPSTSSSKPAPSTRATVEIDEDLDVIFQKGCANDDHQQEPSIRKRSISGQADIGSASKKLRLSENDIIEL